MLAHERESVYLRDGRSPRTRRGGSRHFPKVTVTSEFQHGELLPGGLRAVHTPGHSPGHTALLHEETGVLFTGDAVMNVRGVRYAPGFLCTDAERNRQSADHLGELDFEVAAFAHGPELRRDAAARRAGPGRAGGEGGDSGFPGPADRRRGRIRRWRPRPAHLRLLGAAARPGQAGPPGGRPAQREPAGRRRRVRPRRRAGR